MSIRAIAMQPACMPGVYSPQASPKTRFGSFGTAMVSVFQPISENFVWDFTAQDIFALWIPRIITALRRGRHPYDPNEDPQMREGKPFQQWLHSVYQNAKGLNWSNAREESYREFETGPGIFIAPSIVMALGTTALMGHMGLQMSNKDLHKYSQALQAWNANGIEPNTHANKVAQQFFKHLLESTHFNAHLTQPLPVPTPAGTDKVSEGLVTFLKEQTKVPNPSGKEALKAWTKVILDQGDRDTLLKFLNKETLYTKPWYQRLGLHSGEPEKMSHLLDRILMTHKDITVKDALETWTEAWQHVEKKHPFDFHSVRQFNELESGLKRITYWYNNTYHPTMAANALTMPSLTKDAKGIVKVESLFDNMRKFRGFVQKLYTQHNGQPKQWHSAIQTLLESSTIRKAALSVVGTVAACFTVVLVSAKAQKGRAYPANRNVQLTGTTTQTAPPTSQPPEWMPIHNSQGTSSYNAAYNPFSQWPVPTYTAQWPMGGLV